jgi:hypothetical protein
VNPCFLSILPIIYPLYAQKPFLYLFLRYPSLNSVDLAKFVLRNTRILFDMNMEKSMCLSDTVQIMQVPFLNVEPRNQIKKLSRHVIWLNKIYYSKTSGCLNMPRNSLTINNDYDSKMFKSRMKTTKTSMKMKKQK